jgi:transcriptional regulator with XRE-family HTH domain
MDPKQSFGLCLRSLREKAGLTQKQLAERAGVTLGDIRNLEQGIHNARWTTVRALADALGVTCEAITNDNPDVPQARMGRPRKTRAAEGPEDVRPSAPPAKARPARKRKGE